MREASVVGAGLAGCEAAWQLAERGIRVKLYEMKPQKHSPAHHADTFAELVCSNSLRSDALSNAVGLLKEEMRTIGSLIMEAADHTRVPAGSALAVDRNAFSQYVTDRIRSHPLIEVIEQEITEIPAEPVIIAAGPLCSDGLMQAVRRVIPENNCYFYDAAAPIVTAESIDMNKAYRKSRYDKGEADYINCPMDIDEFNAFYEAVINAEKAELHTFEKEVFFEGCMPFEVMA
ncbi:MAG: methylenetetrahydrofolate--tRNA-(uracil(54)-C(5))-methyltransferase (FADH(2)-oxidizing) TrmFO, partial [Solobacterium sp.]|nr:methylenetetrahydrofolate--tRNA-(uracil(54)-C(5))-methyltransferase (FADH(2)-oxidizing) TrmFO [Solobacterium sp.]